MPLDLLHRLSSGRVLAYDDVGEDGGIPVLYFHGGGDSRQTRHPDDTIASSLGVRLIAVDRCGSGLSDLDRPGNGPVEKLTHPLSGLSSRLRLPG